VLGAFLPRYNRRFAVPAAEPGLAYRPLEEDVDMDTVFCFKYWRTVGVDNVVALGDEHRLQLLRSEERESYAHARVQVHERLDGSLVVYHEGRRIGYKPAPLEAPVLRARKQGKAARPNAASSAPDKEEQRPDSASPEPEMTRRPAHNHPWRVQGRGVLALRQVAANTRNTPG